MRLDCTGPRPRLDLDALAPSPTTEQRGALAFDREVAVAAGAGSGKTQTLSLRFAVLMLELAVDAALAAPLRPRPEIERVLVLTFTEKAAEEMADRCTRRLLALSRAVRDQRDEIDARYGQGLGRALAAAVDHLVDTSDRAAISTFHGFCARVLREHPGETATAPGFEVLEEADASALRDEAIEGALQALYAERGGDLPALYDAFGRREALVEALRVAIEERGRLEERLAAHARGEVRVEDWLAEADPGPEAVSAWLDDEALPLVEGVLALIEPGAKPFCDELRGLARRLATPQGDPLERNALYRDVCEAFANGDGQGRTLTHHSVLGAVADWPSKAVMARHKEALGPWQAGANAAAARLSAARRLPVALDAALVAALRAFATLALDALARLRARLDARRALDFAELQHRAVTAVRRSPELRDRLAGRIRWLMVDEFQDTDESQWALVKALGRPAGAPSDRLFVVGDAKQAIYGFRGGDVTVFRGAFHEMASEPTPLSWNFRSRDGLIAWFDAAFATVLGPSGHDRPAWEAAHEALRPGRGTPGGSVLLVPHEAPDAATAAGNEALAVARWIAGEILPGRGVYEGAGLLDVATHPTPPVAILLQRRTWQSLFEAALRQVGVPFVVARGVGFWARPEVLDLVNTLHALATDDPISVMGALRSPLFAVPDDDLFDLAAGHPERLARFGAGEVPTRCSPHVRRAWERFGRLRGARDRSPVSGLLRRLLSEGVAWHAWALDEDFGVAEANARRLVDLAARFDARGPDGLQTVADWCVRRVEEAERESEAAVLPSAARVVLMTVHGAKGLEFPVVVIPQAGSKGPPRNAPLVVGRTTRGWDVAFTVPDATAAPRPGARPLRRRGRPGRLALLDGARVAEEAAEDRRLLYVAATRARDHLVVVGEVGRNGPKAGSWLSLLAEHHDFPLVARDGADVRPIADLLAAVPAMPPWRAPAAPPPERAEWAPVEAPTEIEVTPSSLDLFAACPARWVLRHVARVPEDVPGRQGGADWGARLGGVRGEVVHSLLEDDVAEDEEVAASRWRARARATGCPPEEVERLLPVVLAHARRAAADPEVQALLAQEGLVEVGFRVPFGPVALRGQIDRLWRESATGEWVVVDWKSEAIPQGPLVAAARHERQLRAYAWAASKVLVAHGQPPVRRGMLYFTATGQSVRLPEWSDEAFSDLEELLRAAGKAAIAPWREVEARSIDPAKSRPCESCGFRGRACRGQPAVAARESASRAV